MALPASGLLLTNGVTSVASSGTVASVAGGDNFHLDSASVTVQWEAVAITNYGNGAAATNRGELVVDGNGTWTGAVSIIRYQPLDGLGGTSNRVTFQAVGSSARLGLPRSAAITVADIVVMPEPGGIAMLLASGLAALLAGRNTNVGGMK